MSVLDRPAQLGIYLRTDPGRDLRVGTLMRGPDGAVVFIVDDAYISLSEHRPILSLSWVGSSEELSLARLNNRGDKMMRGGLLPAFFQNLLPEGALRELVDRSFGGQQFDQFDVLARLGDDLPGAVVALPEAGRFMETLIEPSPEPDESTKPIRFSLAGMQLKFSMTRRGSLTVPAQHGNGEIILKTPTPKHQMVPESEYTAMMLAGAAGVRVAEAWLVDPEEVIGIPAKYLAGGPSLAVGRFDRKSSGHRIHIEDFAQIYQVIGDQKYATGNEATIMRTVQRFATDGRGEMLESVRRVTTNILLGNGDAHLKNWSFIYPEPGVIALSPAYDIVPTFAYGDSTMAMKLGGTNNPYIMGAHKFERVAGLLQVDPKIILNEVRSTIRRALEAWPAILAASPMSKKHQARLIGHLSMLPIIPELVPGAKLPHAPETEADDEEETDDTSSKPKL